MYVSSSYSKLPPLIHSYVITNSIVSFFFESPIMTYSKLSYYVKFGCLNDWKSFNFAYICSVISNWSGSKIFIATCD